MTKSKNKQTKTDRAMKVTLNREHAWNLDATLAQTLDQGLTMLLDGPAEQDSDMERARDLFRRYADKWNNGMEAELYDANSKDSRELDWALQWLAENFTGLWD